MDYKSKIDAARKEGYSDEEIVGFLSKSNPDISSKIKTAQKEGYGNDEILGHLSSFKSPYISGDPALNPNQKSSLLPTLANSSALPMTGGIIGGMLGNVPGAGLGGAGGEAYRQLLAKAIGQPSPQTTGEAIKNIGIEGASQAAGEWFGGTLLPKASKFVGELPGISSAIRGVKKVGGDLFQLVTKIKPQDAETLFKNPKAILPSQWEKAQAAWREAAQNAGIPIDDVSPEIINALKKDARSTVFDTFQKIMNGEEVNAADAQIAKQALDIALMPAAKTERNKPLVALYNKMRQQFVDRIGEESPELALANKQYAIAKAGSKFRSLFPRNLDSSPAYFRSSILPSALFGLGVNRGEPGTGALEGAAAIGLSSPLAIGSAIAGGGLIRPMLPLMRRVISSSLANLAKDKLEGK